MSDSGSELYDSGHRTQRAQRSRSVDSTRSNEQDETEETQDSVSLLTDEPGATFGVQQMKVLLKRALDPLVNEVKRNRVQYGTLERQNTTIIRQNESLQSELKEIKAGMAKGTEDLSALLTTEGIQQLKMIVFRNLDMFAKETDETLLLEKFLTSAKENGWLIKSSAKAQKDIVTNFREKRNYLKAQVRLRIHEDISNKTANYAAKLPKTIKFVMEHLGVHELSEYCYSIIYNLAYTSLKYMNIKGDTSTMNEAEKAVLKEARENIWICVMGRVDNDRKGKRNHETLKEKIRNMIESGLSFEPFKKT